MPEGEILKNPEPVQPPAYKRIETDDIQPRAFNSISEVLWAITDTLDIPNLDSIAVKRRIIMLARIGVMFETSSNDTIKILASIIGQSSNMAEKLEDKTIYDYIKKQMKVFEGE